jgi:iron complex transport system substrate-binding protein
MGAIRLWEWRGAIVNCLTHRQHRDRAYFATYYKWFGLNGPIGVELILEDLRQFLLKS